MIATCFFGADTLRKFTSDTIKINPPSQNVTKSLGASELQYAKGLDGLALKGYKDGLLALKMRPYLKVE